MKKYLLLILISSVIAGGSFTAGWMVSDYVRANDSKREMDYEAKITMFSFIKDNLDALRAIQTRGADSYTKSLETSIEECIPLLEKLPLGDPRDDSWLKEFHDSMLAIGKIPPEWLSQRVANNK